jgi:translation initiation factor IF-3
MVRHASNAPDSRKVSEQGAPQNEAIPFALVQLADPQTGKLHPPAPLRVLLQGIDKTTHYLQLVSSAPPVVKLFDRKAEWAAEKARRVTARDRAHPPKSKELVMTWGVAVGDLAHKLEKAREFLAAGDRVDVLFSPKKKTPVPSPAERKALLQKALDVVRGVGVEWKPRTEERLITTLHLARDPTAAKPQKRQELELSWDFGTGDLERHLAPARDLLENGQRVDVVFATLDGAKPPKDKVQQKFVDNALKLLVGLGVEWKGKTIAKDKTSITLHLAQDPAMAKPEVVDVDAPPA